VTGLCEHCGASFEIELIHNGFNDSSYAYCGDCGMTAILSAYSKRWPAGVQWTYAEIAPEMERHSLLCECGGNLPRVIRRDVRNATKFFRPTKSPTTSKCSHPVPPKDGAGNAVGRDFIAL
jgi:hypothetical protein